MPRSRVAGIVTAGDLSRVIDVYQFASAPTGAAHMH